MHACDLADTQQLASIFSTFKPQRVINLAAHAGVRYSLENPSPYVQSDLVGFANILECCRQNAIEHLVYESSSSVYGANAKIPFSTEDRTDNPVSFFAATKKVNEVMAHSYSHLFGLPTTGLRYFTVYGSWGRPDMAPWLFTEAMTQGKPIKVFNNRKCSRDFTYISDIANGTIALMDAEFLDPSNPCEVHNIGNQSPVEQETFIDLLQEKLGIQAEKIYQHADVERTFADTASLAARTGYQATTSLSDGLDEWVAWYKTWAAR